MPDAPLTPACTPAAFERARLVRARVSASAEAERLARTAA
jgi:hypothetical protein